MPWILQARMYNLVVVLLFLPHCLQVSLEGGIPGDLEDEAWEGQGLGWQETSVGQNAKNLPSKVEVESLSP